MITENSNQYFNITSCRAISMHQLIEDVIVSLLWSLLMNSRLFQKIPFNIGTSNLTLHIEFDANEFTL